ncbi:MAG: MFS transporter [Clostridiaceae bacterium]|nr:MFS transporter [Clostridiaceae bacterium]
MVFVSLSAERLRRRRGPILLIQIIFFWFSLYTYPAILTPYLTEMGASLTSAGLVVGSYGLTQTLLRLPAGLWSDRLHNKRIFVIAGMFLSLISAVGLLYSRQIATILIFRAVAGMAAATWVHSSTLYLAYQPAGQGAKAMGILNFLCNIGTMAAMLTGSLLAQSLGWHSSFLVAVIIAAIGCILSFFISEDKPVVAERQSAAAARHTAGLSLNRQLVWTSLLALLSQFCTFATVQGFVPQYASFLGANKAQIGLLTALSTLPCAVAGLLGGGLLARHFRLRSLIVTGYLLTGVATCLLPLIHVLPLLFVCQIIAGIGFGFQVTLLMSLCTQTVPAERQASAMGFFQAVYGIGMVAGPVLIGLLADWFGLGAGFILIGVIALLSGLLARIVLL